MDKYINIVKDKGDPLKEKHDGRLQFRVDDNGHLRKMVIKDCPNCEEPFFIRKHMLENENENCCSLSCAASLRDSKSGRNHPAYKGKKDYVRDYKENKECKFCGEGYPPCLDFHHTEDNKVESISRMSVLGEYSLEDVKKEVEKCILICKNCHTKLHTGETL